MDGLMWPVLVPIAAIAGWVVISVVNSMARARVREMEVRERIAMIERGLVPAPEADPIGFERAMQRYDRVAGAWDRRAYRAHGRYRRAGITLLGLGFGLMLLLALMTGQPRIGYGVGGFLAILGLAFFVNGLFEHDTPPPPVPPSK